VPPILWILLVPGPITATGECVGTLAQYTAGLRNSDRPHTLRTEVDAKPDAPFPFVVGSHADLRAIRKLLRGSLNITEPTLYALRVAKDVDGLSSETRRDDAGFPFNSTQISPNGGSIPIWESVFLMLTIEIIDFSSAQASA
jgi:hypothetical protein